MRPLLNTSSLWVYPIYAGVGGGFGYWLMGVEERQTAYLDEKRQVLLEKRRWRAERDEKHRGDDQSECLVQAVKEKMAGSGGAAE